MPLQVAEYPRHQREKMHRRRENAKEGAFELDTIKREVDDVRIRIRAAARTPALRGPVNWRVLGRR